MYKNQLQELAQRSCFSLPSYTCIREGPDHAPRFKASVNFNGEMFQGPGHCTTLRQAEHAAAEVALNTLSTRVPSRLLAARVLDEVGVYKNLLQESVHRAGLSLPVYSTERSGPAHLPVFISTVELAGMNFTGEAARTKKQAEKNAAMAAWSSLKQLSNASGTSQRNKENNEEQEHLVVARVLSGFRPKGEQRAVRRSVRSQQERSNTRETHSGPTTTELLHQHQWKPMRLLSDISSSHPKKQLPQTSSKIFPPNSSSKEAQKGVPPPLEQHQKDEDEWPKGERKDMEKRAIKFNTSVHRFNSKTDSILVRTAAYRSNYGIAPAIHIRSVIPVCAAPPRRPPSPNPPILEKKQQDISSVLETSIIKATAEEVPAASSKLNNLQL